MIKTFKKAWRYIGRYKGKFTLVIVMLLIVQLMSFISPLIVKSILDDYIVGIKETWYQVDEDIKAVEYQGKFYKQEKNIKDFSENEYPKMATIFIEGGSYYFTDDFVKSGETSIEGDKLIVKNTDGDIFTYEITKLQTLEVIDFYSPAVKPIIILIALLLLKSIIAILCSFIQNYTGANIKVNIVRDARLDAVRAMQRLPISYFEAEPAGKISSRIIHDVNGLMNLFNTVINLLVNASVSFVFAYVGMFYLDYKLALLTFLVYPVVYFWAKFFLHNLKIIATKVSELNSLMIAQLNEIINGITILKIFNYKKQTLADFNKLNQDFMNQQIKEVKLHTTLGWNMISFIRGLITAVIVTYFGFKQLGLAETVVTAGLIYAYNEYLLKIVDPINILFRQVSVLEHACVRTERIFKIIDGEKEDFSCEHIERYKGDIEFKHVNFSYVQGTPVLKDVSFTVDSGQMVGIVGHTGSGKSTMMSLLLRFYDIKEQDYGQILVDGKDITLLSKRTYRSHIGIILQEPFLFRGTILSNIRFGNDNVTEQEAEEVLRKIGGGHIIDRFDEGINQEIMRGGGNLSLGEKQLISFARALVCDPAILVMDEATANIDTDTEEMINKALDVVSRNRTTIVIAHRLSTIKNADKIIVLDNGYKKEEGTHKQLLQENGVYANIYRSQVKIEQN